MNLNNQSIEDFFKSEFENFQIVPHEKVWYKIEKKMALKRFLKLNYSQVNIYYLAAVLFVVASLFFLDFTNNESIPSKLSVKANNETFGNSQTSTKELIAENEVFEKNETSVKTNQNLLSKKTSNLNTSNNNNNAKALVVIEQDVEVIIENTNEIVPFTQNKINEDSVRLKTKVTRAKNAFSVNLLLSSTQGCAPLNLYYEVISESAKTINIDLGNGTYSNSLNSNITYDIPGTYVISIIAEDANGKVICKKDTIEVFPNPKPVVIIDADSDCKENCIAYFYNYSTDAVKYKWDFGDQNNSFIKDPVHIYTNTDHENIKLIVWSDKMCKDSLMLKTPFKKSNTNKIVFPTAFMPSLTGSNNGYYSLYNYSSDIFYPVSSGVAEYKLEIYSRSGILLFQTFDINQGWDGYYKYELMPQNVYLWKVTGKFENGELIDMAGDLTLLRK